MFTLVPNTESFLVADYAIETSVPAGLFLMFDQNTKSRKPIHILPGSTTKETSKFERLFREKRSRSHEIEQNITLVNRKCVCYYWEVLLCEWCDDCFLPKISKARGEG